MHTLYIKNMVCNRCSLVVTQQLDTLGITPVTVQLGEVGLAEPLSPVQLKELQLSFSKLGFEILDDPNQQIIEKIKNLLIERIQTLDIKEHFSISEYIGNSLCKEYSPLSKLFSQVEGITVEQFFIIQKIEKVKELLFYNEYSLSQIAWKLGYSSVQHLSAQFKKITGLTPSSLKSMSNFKRKPLDETY